MGLKSSESFYQIQSNITIVFSKKTGSLSVKSDVGGDSTINKVKFVPHNLLQQGTRVVPTIHMVADWWQGTVSTSPASPPRVFQQQMKTPATFTYQPSNLPICISYRQTYNKENYKFTSGLGTWLYLYFIIRFLHK